MKQVTIEDLVNDFKQIIDRYKKNNGDEANIRYLSRDYYRHYSKYTDRDWAQFFHSFKEFRAKMLELLNITISEIEGITRDNISSVLDLRGKARKRYFVTAVIAGATVNLPFLTSIHTYCSTFGAQLIILPMRGIYKKDEIFDEVLNEYLESMHVNVIFNNRLQAFDFRLSPRQINPLTSLARYGKKSTSLIIASPKQQMLTVPTSNVEVSHVLYSTGVLTLPNYKDTRIDVLARQDHVCGGLIVEIENDTDFYIRTVRCDAKGGFYDLDTYYCGNKTYTKPISAFIMGDLHCGFEDLQAIKAWKDCIRALKPKYVVLHDIIDCASINHHEEGNLYYNLQLPPNLKTLRGELNTVGKFLQNLCTEFSDIQFIITKGNHDMWLDDFLAYGKYAHIEHKENHLLSLNLAKVLLLGKNPLKEYLTTNFDLKNTIWLECDESFKLHNIQLGVHGSHGNNGGRASLIALETSYGPGIYGHTHSPGMLRDIMTVGTSTKLRLFYNRKGGSSWLHASAILYSNGARTLIIPNNGRWKLTTKKINKKLIK